MTPPDRSVGHGGSDRSRFRLWDVPTSVWVYGLARALSFAVPVDGTGGGIDLVVALLLYVLVVRGSRVAWSAALILDILTLVYLLAVQQRADTPWLIPICIAVGIVALLLPSTRAYVVGHPAKRTRD